MYSDEQLADAVANSTSISGALRYLGIRAEGSSHTHFSKRIKKLGLDMSHFAANLPPVAQASKRTPESIFSTTNRREPRKFLARALVEIGRPYECEKCGVGKEWQGDRLVLHVDHVSGDSLDNSADNLRFLCPNCHSQCWETNRPHKNGPGPKQ